MRTFEDIIEGVIRTFEGRLRTFDALMLGLSDDEFEDAYELRGERYRGEMDL